MGRKRKKEVSCNSWGFANDDPVSSSSDSESRETEKERQRERERRKKDLMTSGLN